MIFEKILNGGEQKRDDVRVVDLVICVRIDDNTMKERGEKKRGPIPYKISADRNVKGSRFPLFSICTERLRPVP